jgi:hypothetical protein
VADRDSGGKPTAGGRSGKTWGWRWQWSVVLGSFCAGVQWLPSASTTSLTRYTWTGIGMGMAFLGLQGGLRPLIASACHAAPRALGEVLSNQDAAGRLFCLEDLPFVVSEQNREVVFPWPLNAARGRAQRLV